MKKTVMVQNVLMILAAVLAVVIGRYPEAAAIVLLYVAERWLLKTVTARTREQIAGVVDLESVEQVVKTETRLEKRLARFTRIFTPAAVAAAAAAALFFFLKKGDWQYGLRTACTFLVISCPWVLSASIRLAYLCGIAVSRIRGIRFKDGTVMEKISNMRLAAVGCRGILTDGRYGLQRVVPAIAFEEEEEGVEAESEEEFVLRLCAGAAAGSSFPLADSIARAAKTWKVEAGTPLKTKESREDGVTAVLPEGEVLCGTREYFLSKHIQIPEPLQAYGAQIQVALNGDHIGTLLFSDRLRNGAESLIKALHHVGAKTVVITGESKLNADAIARSLNIDVVHADLRPEQKTDVMKQLLRKGGDTLYIGTGRTDASLMGKATASGMLKGGTDEAAEAAGILYDSTELKPVEDSIDLAFCTTRIASENAFLSILMKAGIIFLGMVGYANLWLAIAADAAIAVICIINAVRLPNFGKYWISNKTKRTS